MGCGTSVLAIYAKMKGAKDVLAIDIDEWSVKKILKRKCREKQCRTQNRTGNC